VDTETDAKIRDALEKRFGQATIILISHRMTTLSRADRVLVLDHGRVAQLGTPEELRKEPGLFREIDRIQRSAAADAEADATAEAEGEEKEKAKTGRDADQEAKANRAAGSEVKG